MTGEEEEGIRPGVLAAFFPFLPLICTSEDSLAQAALRGQKTGSSTGTSHYIPFLGRTNIWAATHAVLRLQKLCLRLLFRKVPHEVNTTVI